MTKKALLIGIFTVVVFAQIFIPLSVIAKWENVLEKGVQYKFKTAPVDPYDAFRGRYVALRFEKNSVPVDDGKKYSPGMRVFVILENDSDGYAVPSGVQLERPSGENYLNVKVNYLVGNNLYFNYDIDRYYMNEKDAPEAERAYARSNRRSGAAVGTYVTVKILGGCAVLEKLYINGVPVEEFIKKDKANQ